MSMLAERKRKTRYVLNPSKKPLWTTDSCGIKFGKELMEKMGWSAGKGLGAKEQGIQEPLRVSYKNDSKGMGYKGNEENWLEYQDEFNCLLNQLAGSAENNIKTKVGEKSEVTSLEEKSKLSKARVHYQKFTRGKDISKYSEDDLSCILGTSKLKKANNEPKVEKEILPENNVHETSFGITTINSGSIEEYFKRKWTLNNLKSKNSNAQHSQNGFVEEQQFNDSTTAGLGNVSKKRHGESEDESLEITCADKANKNIEKDIKKHKKKKTKLDLDIDLKESNKNESEGDNSPENISTDCIEDTLHSKKKKKKKREGEELQEFEPEDGEVKSQSEILLVKTKNKKRKKEKESELKSTEKGSFMEEVIKNFVEEESQNKTLKENSPKKKRRKTENKAEELAETGNYCQTGIDMGVVAEELKTDIAIAAEEKTKKKKKKKKDVESQNANNCEEEVENEKSQMVCDVEENTVKKKRKEIKSEVKSVEKEPQNEAIKENLIKKKKRETENKAEESSKTDDYCQMGIDADAGAEALKNVVEVSTEEKTKKKKKKKKDVEFQNENNCEEQVENEECQSGNPFEKNPVKKRKKEKWSEVKATEGNSFVEKVSGNLMVEEQKETQVENLAKKKRKTTENKGEKLPETDNYCQVGVDANAAAEALKNVVEVSPEEKTKKKKKKKKDVEFQDANNLEKQVEDEKSQFASAVQENSFKKQKKKKEKRVENFETEDLIYVDENARENSQNDAGVVKKEKKTKKCLEESEKGVEEQISSEFLGKQAAVEDDLIKKKKKRKSKENTETQSQPEEVRKKSKKSKKENKEGESENKHDQLEVSTSQSQDKMSKKKDKCKTESCSETTGTSEMFEKAEDKMNNNKEEKENENGVECSGEVGVTLIHTHKTSLLQMKKPFTADFKQRSTAETLNLICGAAIEKFKGANLGSLPGYGYKKNEKHINR